MSDQPLVAMIFVMIVIRVVAYLHARETRNDMSTTTPQEPL